MPADDHHPPTNPLQPLPPADVPVFDCQVIVGRCTETGSVLARVANLPQLTARAGSEREALQRVVRTFKMFVSGYHQRGEAIPWVEPPERPGADEQMRWLPVHL